MKQELSLGKQAECVVTGIKGILVARVEYLNGCVQWCVQPKGATDALRSDAHYIDQGQLRVVGAGVSVERKKTGGPSSNTPRGMGR